MLCSFLFFRVYSPNFVIGIVLMVHQPLNPPPSDTRGLPRPDPLPELDTPSYQILENTLGAGCYRQWSKDYIQATTEVK